MNEQDEYLTLIKKRLVNYVENSGRSLNSIYKDCNKGAKDEDIISYPTIYNLLKGNKLPNNLSHIKLIADVLGIDLGLLLSADPGIQLNQIPIISNNQPLDNDQYIQNYYIYTYTSGKSKRILLGRLNIVKDQNMTTASLELEVEVHYIDGKVVKQVERYTGTPIYNKAYNTVYMFLQSSKGDFYFISYYYRKYNYQKMYYRKASCVCIHTITKTPIIKNMIILSNQADEAFIRDYLPGLLKIEDKNFYIPKSSLEELMNNSFIQQYVNTYQSDIGEAIEMYQINPNKLLSNFESYERNEIIDMQKFITLLQAHSISFDKAIYSEKENEALLIKEYQGGSKDE